MNVLIIGSGGREHAIAAKLKQSRGVFKLYCIPGNAGIAQIAECHPINVMDFEAIINFLHDHEDIGLTVVAPDNPLAAGLVDKLEAQGFRAFGPTAAAARIEGSKAFAKALMKKYNIPTADYETFSDFESAERYIMQAKKFPLVVKADGLALGKGVIICANAAEAVEAARGMLLDGSFSEAGREIVIEEFLSGREVSVLAFTDGKTIVPMESCQDYKRAFDGDQGLNTGGMGAYSPVRWYTPSLAQKAYKTIFEPTIMALRKEGRPFKGVIYFGLMVDGEDIRVLEYNARFGDPETQAILPRLDYDLLTIFQAVVDERLHELDIKWKRRNCVCVVLASEGYPAKPIVGREITIGDTEGAFVYHAGTKREGGKLLTSGGRVIATCALAYAPEEARQKAYAAAQNISFEGMHYRKDICPITQD